MKILIITDTFPPEKVGSYRMHDLATYLSEDLFNVSVICPPPTFPFGNFKPTWKPVLISSKKNYKLVNLWTWQPHSPGPSAISRIAYYSIMPLLSVFWILFNRDFDVIITSSGSSPFIFLPGLFAKKLLRKSWIIDVRDLLTEGAISLGFLKKESLLTNYLRKFELLCYSLANLVFVTSENAKRTLLNYGVTPQKLKKLLNAPDTRIFYPRSILKKRQIIYVGNLGHAYDFVPMILMMKELAKMNIKLLIVGEGDLKQYLKHFVYTNHLSKHVIFLDGVERNELSIMISESMVGLAPVKNLNFIGEAIPAKIFDYMACAIPFVASGGVELKKIASTTGAGYVKDNEVSILVKTIKFLIENPKIREELGRNGSLYCEKYHNRRLMAKKIGTMISNLMIS